MSRSSCATELQPCRASGMQAGIEIALAAEDAGGEFVGQPPVGICQTIECAIEREVERFAFAHRRQTARAARRA